MKRRDFCKTAAALLAAGTLAPHAAADALLPEETQAVVGSIVPEDRYPISFRSDHSETDLTHDFYYTDAFFENTALKYDHRLALATLGLVAACGNTYRSDDLYWLEGEAGREDHIAAAYRELGFANPVCVGYQSSLNTPADRAAFAFVPYIGALASCAIGVLLTLLAQPEKALLCLIVYQAVQFTENQFIYPHVVGSSVGLAPLWTLLAALLGGKLFGLVGIVFFIPLTAVVLQLVHEHTAQQLSEKKLDREDLIE